MAEFSGILVNAMTSAMAVFGEPVTVIKKDDSQIEVLAVVEKNVEIVGEYGQRIDRRDRLWFLNHQVLVEIGDRVVLDDVERTVDARDTDDGVSRAVWLR
ncbi:hypothetical protein Nhal_1001 [Nitrosococcus halophilus Nc 4]|uniref:Uncharacterized protein n=1 Tax=Nitrosococcus halophilus (strain Nc4) TaxID=472759 RepID=D5BYW1_NITHN|nr:hypothetical protein [Nitrosococcus halophilus]ADE14174.1 hypothetical protein Nhal_1001 [Nitrosococcus halophilus Nc 4]